MKVNTGFLVSSLFTFWPRWQDIFQCMGPYLSLLCPVSTVSSIIQWAKNVSFPVLCGTVKSFKSQKYYHQVNLHKLLLIRMIVPAILAKQTTSFLVIVANLIKYGNLALDNLLTLGQISNKEHRDRQIDRQTGLSSMVASFVYKTLGGLRTNNNYNNVTHSSTFFPIIFKIIGKTKKESGAAC